MSEKCFECDEPAKHDHHVIPEALGGTKTVPLCENCHSKVHGTDLRISELQKEAVRKTILKFKELGKQWGGGGWNKTDPDRCRQVQELRQSGKTLEEVSEITGISVPTICRIMKGTLHTTESHKHY